MEIRDLVWPFGKLLQLVYVVVIKCQSPSVFKLERPGCFVGCGDDLRLRVYNLALPSLMEFRTSSSSFAACNGKDYLMKPAK